MISSTVIIVSWSEPDAPNGIITFYEIIYTVGNVSSLDGNVFSRAIGATADTSYQVTFTGLDPFTVYSGAVRAYTRIGAGEFTDIVHVYTDRLGGETKQVT